MDIKINDPFFSVIIPIYNVENYLEKCVDSVLNQTELSYELILVDDGSTDSSGYICERIKREHPSIQVLHKKNGGLSSARNEGMKVSSGEFIVFLDSDDYWIDDNTLKKVKEVIISEKSEIITWNRVKFLDGKEPVFRIKNKIITTINPGTQRCDGNTYEACAWSKAVSRKLIGDMEFEDNAICEDYVWSAHLLRNASRVTFTNYNFSAYRQRKGSISKTPNKKMYKDIISHMSKINKIINEEQGIRKKNLLSYAAQQYANAIIMVGKMDKDKGQLARYSFLLKYGNTKRTGITYIMVKMLGMKATSKLLDYLYRLKNKIVFNDV